ncbi:MAG: thrombospondin type 3 repeat-containing protein [Deltaproteobacteria bacterium]|nr:thrombospondin type 3 repeat-containing protein [Deltaproteobacteria bacterium]
MKLKRSSVIMISAILLGLIGQPEANAFEFNLIKAPLNRLYSFIGKFSSVGKVSSFLEEGECADGATNIFRDGEDGGPRDVCAIDGDHLATAIGYFNNQTYCFEGDTDLTTVKPVVFFDTKPNTVTRDELAGGTPPNCTDEEITVTVTEPFVISGENVGDDICVSADCRRTAKAGLTISGFLSKTTIDAMEYLTANPEGCVFDIRGEASNYHTLAYLTILVPEGDGVKDHIVCVDGAPQAVDSLRNPYTSAKMFLDPSVVIMQEGVADADGDGVEDSVDQCPGSNPTERIDPATGCPIAAPGTGCAADDADQGDTDGDGVKNCEDQCPAEAAGATPDPARPGCPTGTNPGGSNVPNCVSSAPTVTTTETGIAVSATYTAQFASSIKVSGGSATAVEAVCPNQADDTCSIIFETSFAPTPGGDQAIECETKDDNGVSHIQSFPVAIAVTGGGGGGGGNGAPACLPNDETCDSDGDGLNNGQDNCINVPNPDQTDTDGNGVGDACVQATSLSDLDNDGLTDFDEDLCGTDKNKVDTDGDGLDDYEECTSPLYPRLCALNSDCDLDAVCDGGAEIPNVCKTGPDNCRIVKNEGQEDTGGIEGLGDACEGDIDGDGICDGVDPIEGLCTEGPDNCNIANPDQADANGNGIGDVCDGLPALTADSGCGCTIGGSAAPGMQGFGMILIGMGLALVRRMRKR